MHLISLVISFFAGGIITFLLTKMIVNKKLKKRKDKERPALLTYKEYKDISGLQRLLALKDAYTESHSIRVAEYSRIIAKEMKWKGKLISDIYKAGMLHDIGKIGIPDEILNKKGKLTDKEYNIIKSHPLYSEHIMRAYNISSELCIAVRHHHERYDGKGYPDGLKGEEIPIMSRIIAVADAYDAMVTSRVYRNNMSIDNIISELKNGSGTQFDPEILKVFCKSLRQEKKLKMREVKKTH